MFEESRTPTNFLPVTSENEELRIFLKKLHGDLKAALKSSKDAAGPEEKGLTDALDPRLQ